MRFHAVTLILPLALGLLLAPLAADAQQAGKVYRVGFLWDSPAGIIGGPPQPDPGQGNDELALYEPFRSTAIMSAQLPPGVHPPHQPHLR